MKRSLLIELEVNDESSAAMLTALNRINKALEDLQRDLVINDYGFILVESKTWIVRPEPGFRRHEDSYKKGGNALLP